MAWVAVLVGAGTPALIVLAGPLALIDERLIEVPLVLIGCAWVWLGGTMLGSANAAPAVADTASQAPGDRPPKQRHGVAGYVLTP